MSSSATPGPAAITIRSWRCIPHRVILLLGVWVPLALGLGLGAFPSIAAYIYTVAVLGGILLLYRVCRHGVRFDDTGITVRNFYQTYKLSWHDVSHFSDGEIVEDDGQSWGPIWALKIVLNDGRSVTAEGTMGINSRTGGLATIEQVAARWQIPTQLAAKKWPASRRRDRHS